MKQEIEVLLTKQFDEVQIDEFAIEWLTRQTAEFGEPAAQAPAVQDGLTDEQRIDWLCEEAVYTCGQWQVVFDSDKKSFIDAVDELAALAHGIDKGQPPVQGT